jgi:demethylmenaquinone methyltransferase/2-methoxy-6-polyprenyl-1,4-benzoquinol methylase
MYTQDYNVKAGNETEQPGWIPVTSRWLGSWRVSIDRRAHDVVELTDRYNDEAASWQNTLARLGIARSYQSIAATLGKRLENRDIHCPVRILDCGAGTATLSIALAKTCTRETRISAVDISAGMIQQASKAFDEAGLSVDLERADVRKLPHASNTQDVVIAAHVLEHLADPSIALAEMYRVLKPGGLIVLCCTRRSLSGRWIQMKWRTHTVTQSMLFQWLSQQGFTQISPLLIDNSSQLHKLSLAVTASKTEMVCTTA